MTVIRANKFGPECTRWLRHFGWEFDGWTGTTHARFVHPELEPIALASSPSVDPRKGLLHEMAKRLGQSKPEVEVALGLRPPKREGPKIKRERNDAGRQARRFEPLPEAKPVREINPRFTPERRMEWAKREIREAIVRQNRAHLQGDEPGYLAAMDDHKRLSREYTEAELEMRAAA